MTPPTVWPGLETNTIFQIPPEQRHGRPWDLFAIWFGANLMMLTVVTGALAPAAFHLTFLQSALAIVLGNAVGGVFMALHAAQGAVLGVPQMVQTRGQFGAHGAVAVIGLVVVMYVGFTASNFVLAGQSLHALGFGPGARAYGTAICLISLVAAIYGHDAIHAYAKAVSWIAGAALLLCFAWILYAHGLPHGGLDRGHFTLTGFLSAFSIGAVWQIAYAPYVSDYSRYLPPGVGARQAFWASYGGCVLGSIGPMILGALVAGVAGSAEAAAFDAALGPVAAIVVPIFAFGIVAGSAMNIYCGVLASLTVAQTFVPDWRARPSHRVTASCVLAALALGIASLAAGNFLETYTSFILLLFTMLVPWTAINLVDFYLVRHGEYDVAAFFRADGGQYGRYNAPALGCYAIGILVQVPFVANPLFTGTVARLLGGADVSWLVGLVVAGPLYWVVAHDRRRVTDVPESGVT